MHGRRRVPGGALRRAAAEGDIGKSCVRFDRTDDVDLGVLRELLAEAARLGPAAEAV